MFPVHLLLKGFRILRPSPFRLCAPFCPGRAFSSRVAAVHYVPAGTCGAGWLGLHGCPLGLDGIAPARRLVSEGSCWAATVVPPVSYLSVMKAFSLRFALLGLLAAGCSNGSDPAPRSGLNLPNNYPLSVRLTGQGLGGLGAHMVTTVASALEGQPLVIGPGGTEDIYGSDVNKTYALLTVPKYQKGKNIRRYVVRTFISFDNVRPGGLQPGANTRLKVELLANGQIVPATAPGNGSTQALLADDPTNATVTSPSVGVTLQTEYL